MSARNQTSAPLTGDAGAAAAIIGAGVRPGRIMLAGIDEPEARPEFADMASGASAAFVATAACGGPGGSGRAAGTLDVGEPAGAAG